MERRTFLALAAAAVGLAGCTGQSPQPGPPSTPPTPITPDAPDAALRDEVAAGEVALIAAYRKAITADPQLAADLERFLAHHEQHLARVSPGYAPDTSSASAPSSGTPASPEASAAPPSASEVLDKLAAAESAARAQRATACDGAQDPALARDLCLIAASEAQHAAALAGLAAKGPGPTQGSEPAEGAEP